MTNLDRIKNLSKKFGNTVIFENASFVFPDKGLVCVLGPSGCGKSTLLNMIAGFDSDYKGEIAVHGSSLSAMNASELCDYRRDNIGFVFQNYHLLSGYSALENVLLATDVVGKNQEESKQKANKVLAQLGLEGKAEQNSETLSGGQKQRVAIARALINDPSIIFADEPTGALDRKNSSEIMELLKELSEERLVIVITHDKKCAEYAEQIITLTDGQLHCDNEIAFTESSVTLKTNKAPKISLGKRAFKNFKVHLKRYIAVALAISIGVLCFSLSLSSGNIMEKSIADFEAKNTAYHNGYIKVEDNEEELLEKLSQDERIENIYTQSILKNISIKSGEQTVDIEEKYPIAKAKEKMSYGVMPRRGQNEISLSPSLAAKFDRNIQNLIGQTVEFGYDGQTYTLTVSGIFNATFDDCIISSDIEQKIMSGISEQTYSISYDVVEFEDIVLVNNDLSEQEIKSQNASNEVAAFLDTFQNLNRLFLTVSVLIFAIGVFISIILLVKQQNTRYREMGLLSALGYSKTNIRQILFFENIVLSLLSMICSGILTVLTLTISHLAGFSLMLTLPQTLATLCMTAILILAISLISSIKILNTEPAKALRM